VFRLRTAPCCDRLRVGHRRARGHVADPQGRRLSPKPRAESRGRARRPGRDPGHLDRLDDPAGGRPATQPAVRPTTRRPWHLPDQPAGRPNCSRRPTRPVAQYFNFRRPPESSKSGQQTPTALILIRTHPRQYFRATHPAVKSHRQIKFSKT